jgi:hypothetical protein
MSLEQLAYLAEIAGGIAVVASLVYVGIQIRDSNRVNQANARHQISEFVLQVSMFRAEHADRFAEINEKTELTAGDEEFRWWTHMMIALHAETYYHQYVLGLMQEGHWAGYSRYIEGYSVSPGFAEFWADVGPAFSRDFCNWMTEVVNRNHGLSLPRHEDVGGEREDPLKTR